MNHAIRVITLVGVLVCTANMARAGDEKKTAKGRVIDASGKPVAHANVSTYWTFLNGNPRFGPRNRTNEKGEFQIDVYYRGRPITVFAMDKERENAALVNLDPNLDPGTLGKNVIEGITMRLAPLITVRGQFVCTALDKTCGGLNLSLVGKGGSHFAFFPSGGDGRFAMRLPPGSYRWSVFGGLDFVSLDGRSFDLSPGQADVELGLIEMEASVIRKHYGKEPPAWTIREARGLRSDAKISDLKGKWLLIEFWNYT